MLDTTIGANLVRQQRSVWGDPKRVDELRELWLQGLSTSRIGGIMGLTKNQVISKAHRIGMPARRMGALTLAEKELLRKESAARYFQKHGKHKQQARRGNTPRAVKQREPIVHIDDNLIPIAERRTLLQLTSYCCHWPVGDPSTADFFFCGSTDMRDGSSYCRAHYARSVEPRVVRA